MLRKQTNVEKKLQKNSTLNTKRKIIPLFVKKYNIEL